MSNIKTLSGDLFLFLIDVTQGDLFFFFVFALFSVLWSYTNVGGIFSQIQNWVYKNIFKSQ